MKKDPTVDQLKQDIATAENGILDVIKFIERKYGVIIESVELRHGWNSVEPKRFVDGVQIHTAIK